MKILTLTLLTSIVLFSCRKDPKTPAPNLPLQKITLENTPGSYFVYHWFEIDSLGNETKLNYIDTVRVMSDTLIKGNTYVHSKGNYYVYSVMNWYFRDSLGYIVDQNGMIHYSYQNTDTVSFENSMLMEYITINKNNPTTKFNMPAGVINNELIEPKILSYFDHQLHRYNTTEPITACDSVWVSHTKYVDGYGEVASQSGYISSMIQECKYAQRRLVFFDIK